MATPPLCCARSSWPSSSAPFTTTRGTATRTCEGSALRDGYPQRHVAWGSDDSDVDTDPHAFLCEESPVMSPLEFWVFLPQMRLSMEQLVERARAAEAAGFSGVAGM